MKKYGVFLWGILLTASFSGPVLGSSLCSVPDRPLEDEYDDAYIASLRNGADTLRSNCRSFQESEGVRNLEYADSVRPLFGYDFRRDAENGQEINEAAIPGGGVWLDVLFNDIYDTLTTSIREARKVDFKKSLNLGGATFGLPGDLTRQIVTTAFSFRHLNGDLSFNNGLVDSLPHDFSALKNVKILDLSWNQLTEISPNITSMECLTWLDLRANKLKRLPDEIGRMPSLTYLALDRNQLEVLPSTLNTLSPDLVLSLSGNPLLERGRTPGEWGKAEIQAHFPATHF